MERNCLLYKVRRNMQAVAYRFFSEEVMSGFYFRIVLKKKLNLLDPKTFNEKIQWLKLYHFPNNSLVIQCADKYAVRKYVERKGLGEILVPLIGAWKKVEDINWDEFPNEFVLKCNHGCAYNILCTDKKESNKKLIFYKLNKWMKEDFGVYNIEPHYSKIKPRMIICEKFLGRLIVDYKFFCFNGRPEYIYVSDNLINDRQAHIGFFYLDGRRMPLIRDDYLPMVIDEFPPFFENMKNDATILCQDFTFVRVDFFIANGTYYFAELTFTPSAGMMPFNPDKYDIEWGRMLNIEKLIEHNSTINKRDKHV